MIVKAPTIKNVIKRRTLQQNCDHYSSFVGNLENLAFSSGLGFPKELLSSYDHYFGMGCLSTSVIGIILVALFSLVILDTRTILS